MKCNNEKTKWYWTIINNIKEKIDWSQYLKKEVNEIVGIWEVATLTLLLCGGKWCSITIFVYLSTRKIHVISHELLWEPERHPQNQEDKE